MTKKEMPIIFYDLTCTYTQRASNPEKQRSADNHEVQQTFDCDVT